MSSWTVKWVLVYGESHLECHVRLFLHLPSQTINQQVICISLHFNPLIFACDRAQTDMVEYIWMTQGKTAVSPVH